MAASGETYFALREEKLSISIWGADFYVELAFPYLFPEENVGYKIDRQVKISPGKYFNQQLLNYNQLFASVLNYIFFGLSVTQ